MNDDEIGSLVVDSAFQVHTKLGPGLLESVYEVVLSHELRKRGLRVTRQVPIKVNYDNMTFEDGFRADIMIERQVIIEIKSVETLHPVHKKQLLTYLKLADVRLGYLINFGAALMKEGLSRIVNGADDWGVRSHRHAN